MNKEKELQSLWGTFIAENTDMTSLKNVPQLYAEIKSFISKVEAEAHQAGREEAYFEFEEQLLFQGTEMLPALRLLDDMKQSLEQKEK